MKLLLLYEIADRAAKVTSKQNLLEYEKWVTDTLKQYKDAAIERAARSQIFRLKNQFAI
ncbi:MAG TPA: hypothetical protein VEC17_03605 [Candidatus Binatia bacterium]|nr:hypothetical protein [Candidatus Binatia bacterium]